MGQIVVNWGLRRTEPANTGGCLLCRQVWIFLPLRLVYMATFVLIVSHAILCFRNLAWLVDMNLALGRLGLLVKDPEEALSVSVIHSIPELSDFGGGHGLIRIPPETDVPLTRRVRRLIDTRAFRRLSRISQLGLVSLVYPAAHHSRFEHSLGVFRTALTYLGALAGDSRFVSSIRVEDAELFLAAALLHDIGHWPFCHPIEDLGLAEVPRHETFAASFIEQGEVADILLRDWGIEPARITSILRGEHVHEREGILCSLLSGPIDVDKMDYLGRDSLHAGVPYGNNYDRARLINSLCLNEQGDALAISDKGRTAAEMMVFARYVMFSEVYWHHAVRSATAMLQRAVFRLVGQLDLQEVLQGTEEEVVRQLLIASVGTSAEPLLTGLFGVRRRLFKRVEQYSFFQSPEIYQRLARRPYSWLVRCSECLANQLSGTLGIDVVSDQVLIDAPPKKREIEMDIDVWFPKESRYRSLRDVSPVVQTLATTQFDDYVKRVRIFVDPTLAAQSIANFPRLLERAIGDADAGDDRH